MLSARGYGIGAAVAVLALTQVAYAEVSIRILGSWSPSTTIKAGDIGSGLAGLSCSELAAGLAVLALVAAATGAASMARLVGIALVIAVGYDVVTLKSHTIHATAGGQSIDSLIGARISPAWGAWAMLLASVVVAIASFMPQRELEHEEFAVAPDEP